MQRSSRAGPHAFQPRPGARYHGPRDAGPYGDGATRTHAGASAPFERAGGRAHWQPPTAADQRARRGSAVQAVRLGRPLGSGARVRGRPNTPHWIAPVHATPVTRTTNQTAPMAATPTLTARMP